jgi:hypothetical protein
MSHDPVFIAYAVASRPGRKPLWRWIGAAFTHAKGLAVLLNALPLGGRVVLLEPKAASRGTVQFFPAAMPTDLATKPALRGEKRVWHPRQRQIWPRRRFGLSQGPRSRGVTLGKAAAIFQASLITTSVSCHAQDV